MDDVFTPDEAAAWGGFLSVHSRLTKQLEENLRRTAGLSHAEYEVLLRLFLEESGRLRIQALAAKSVLSQSGTSRLVDRLEGAGLVERAEAPDDKRGADAVLTAEGRARFIEVARQHTGLVRELFLGKFSPDELAMMASYWARVPEVDEGPS